MYTYIICIYCLKFNLASRCIPSEVVSENGVFNITVSTCTVFLQYPWYCIVEGQPRSPLPRFMIKKWVVRDYHSLFHHKSFLSFIHYSFIRRAQTSWARSSLFSPWYPRYYLPAFCVSLHCGFDQLSWLRIPHEE